LVSSAKSVQSVVVSKNLKFFANFARHFPYLIGEDAVSKNKKNTGQHKK